MPGGRVRQGRSGPQGALRAASPVMRAAAPSGDRPRVSIRGSEVLRTRFLPLARVIPPRCLADREVGLPGSLPRGFATGAEARSAVRVDRSRGRLTGPIVDPVASATRSLTAAFL